MEKYIEITNGKFHTGTCIPAKQLLKEQKKAVANNEELYRSTYSFNDKIIEHFDSGRKSPSGFIGTYYLDHLLFDIDKGKNDDKITLHRARTFIDTLIHEWHLFEDNIMIWFSGTGYHIVTSDFFNFIPSPELPKVVKATLDKYFPEIDTSFYMSPGLIRVGNTINKKSNLYKIPLSYEEFTTLDAQGILTLAQKPRTTFKFEYIPGQKHHSALIVQPELNNKERKQRIDAGFQSRIVTCVQTMYDLGEQKGTRHDRIMRMTSAWRRAGVPYEAILAAMKAYAPTMNEYEIEKHVKDTFNKNYSFGCEDKVMKEFCNSKCIYYKQKDFSPAILSAKDMEKNLIKFLRTDFTHKAFDFADIFRLPWSFMVYPTYYVNIIADTGMGKTAFMQNIVVALKNFNVLYLSPEVGSTQLYRRFVQISHGMTKEEVNEYYLSHDNSLSDKLDHIKVLDIAPTLDSIKQTVAMHNPRIVVIDPVNDITVTGEKEGTGKDEVVARGLKEIAKENDCIVFTIQHISKSSSTDGEGRQKRMHAHSGKGGSGFEQKADILIGVDGNRESKNRQVSILKGRDDKPFKINCIFDAEQTFRFHQI